MKEEPPQSSSPLAYLISAARAAGTTPPQQVQASIAQASTSSKCLGHRSESSISSRTAPIASTGAVSSWIIDEELSEFEDKAIAEGCTVAEAAQALAQIACRLFDLADDLGGELYELLLSVCHTCHRGINASSFSWT